eukprot:gene11531-11674_t
MPHLTVVDLGFNHISGQPDDGFFGYMPALRELHLQSNWIRGSIRAGWANSSLEVIDLSWNLLNGSLPEQWLSSANSSNNLRIINLAGNRWGAQASNLTTLILSDNPGLSGNVSNLRLPPSLSALHIANTDVSGSFDALWTTRNPLLSCLVAYGARNLCGPLHSSLPCSLVNFTWGTSLALRDAKVLLSWKAQLQDPSLRLSNWNGINPCQPGRHWAGIGCSDDNMGVVVVNISGFGLSGPLPGNLAALSRLQVLDVSNNRLSGELPDALDKVAGLKELDFSNNTFTSTLPSTWSNLVNLVNLRASYNNLQGSLPSSWGRSQTAIAMDPTMWDKHVAAVYMESLQELVCSQCGLSGYLPYEWMNMRLQHVDLSNNMFIGGVLDFGSNTLTTLFLDNNPLESEVWPSLLSDFPSIEVLSLSGCRLTGQVPGV